MGPIDIEEPHGQAHRVRAGINSRPGHRPAVADLLGAGVRRDDLYIDHGVSGAHARRPQFDTALDALHAGDTLIVTTLDRLGRSTANRLTLADELRAQKVNLRVLNLGGGNVDTRTPWDPWSSPS